MPYRNKRFELRIILSHGENNSKEECYPFAAPIVRFAPPLHLHHFAVDNDGKVCLPLIVNDWSPTTSLVSVCDELIMLVVSPEKIREHLKYSTQSWLSEQFRFKRDEYVKECTEKARAAKEAKTLDAHTQQMRRKSKLKKTLAMKRAHSTRFERGDPVRPPERRPPNPPPGWPYQKYQPRLDRVWLGGRPPNSMKEDELQQFASEEWKSQSLKLIFCPIIVLWLLVLNLVKTFSWYALILRSIDGYFSIPDM